MLLTSCQLFDKKVPDEKELLQQELQKINWNQVDNYRITSYNVCYTKLLRKPPSDNSGLTISVLKSSP